MLDSRVGDAYDWTNLHKPFHVSQAQGISEPRRQVLTARPDGCLQKTPENVLPEESWTLSIIEVKPFRRRHKAEKTIRMQEGAQMAAWISTESTYGILPRLNASDTTYRYVSSATVFSAELTSQEGES